jgi:hypothetical protein
MAGVMAELLRKAILEILKIMAKNLAKNSM